eukprot:UN26715
MVSLCSNDGVIFYTTDCNNPNYLKSSIVLMVCLCSNDGVFFYSTDGITPDYLKSSAVMMVLSSIVLMVLLQIT